MRAEPPERFQPPESAALQHSDTALHRNWWSACVALDRALAARDRVRDRVGDPTCRAAWIVGAGDRAPDHEDVAAGTRDTLGSADTRLVVDVAVGKAHARNDGHEVAPSRVHPLDLLHRTDDATTAGVDRA